MILLTWDGKVTDDEIFKMEYECPITHVKIFNNEPIEIHRCESDGGIVTASQGSLKQHAGHRMKQPVLLKKEELYAIIDGKIK